MVPGTPTENNSSMVTERICTDHFNGPDRSVGQMCVRMGIHAVTFEVSEL